MRAAVALLALAGCDAASSELGLEAMLRVEDAQYVGGALPDDGGGPAVSDAFLFRTTVFVGELDLRLQGTLDPASNGVAIGLVGDRGHWIEPSGAPDVFDPERPTFDVDLALARTMESGAYPLAIAALDADGRAGAPWIIDLTIDDRDVPEGTLVLTLRWDTPTDLDLRVVTPDGVEIWARNINSYQPPAPGQPPDPPDAWMSGGILDIDSNASCVIDGRMHENVVWTVAPPAGAYVVKVDAASLCGQPAARWVVEGRLDGELVGTASGLATFEDAALPHDAGAGVRALEVEVP